MLGLGVDAPRARQRLHGDVVAVSRGQVGQEELVALLVGHLVGFHLTMPAAIDVYTETESNVQQSK